METREAQLTMKLFSPRYQNDTIDRRPFQQFSLIAELKKKSADFRKPVGGEKKVSAGFLKWPVFIMYEIYCFYCSFYARKKTTLTLIYFQFIDLTEVPCQTRVDT